MLHATGNWENCIENETPQYSWIKVYFLLYRQHITTLNILYIKTYSYYVLTNNLLMIAIHCVEKSKVGVRSCQNLKMKSTDFNRVGYSSINVIILRAVRKRPSNLTT